MSLHKEVCFVVLCGLPGSGKTSLSLEIKKWLVELDETITLVISYDKLMPPSIESELINQKCEEKSKWKIYREAIVDLVQNFITDINREPNLGSIQSIKKWVSRNMLKDANESYKYSDFNSDFHRTLMAHFSKLINEHLLEVKEEKRDELKEGNMKIVIIIDDNMYFRSMRYDYYQLARNSSVGFCEVYVACSVSLALQRNSQRASGFVEPEIITNMANRFEIPDQSHHSWEKYSLICTTDNIQIHRSYKKSVQARQYCQKHFFPNHAKIGSKSCKVVDSTNEKYHQVL
ncbi:hypothetical protein LOTGIDRAFT_232809 [Lottia gigantea]|uniref:L-seryl-tRNA(Sec) kinase n=1 Tax=Lottia gigantea TaxID=225164 RepID=V4A8I2_LOTGI|nr:hypothetical protein LOTGIDRAFT_232809 [Lottia gigantea]ESO93047.1 hypothetical protein LOTGIDRAFT_232809 [Lottia gigantea]